MLNGFGNKLYRVTAVEEPAKKMSYRGGNIFLVPGSMGRLHCLCVAERSRPKEVASFSRLLGIN